jgi:hypothetical protein
MFEALKIELEYSDKSLAVKFCDMLISTYNPNLKNTASFSIDMAQSASIWSGSNPRRVDWPEQQVYSQQPAFVLS